MGNIFTDIGGGRGLWAALVSVSLASGGCIIGTWPTPEDTDEAPRNDSDNGEPIGPEPCNGFDDDADGAVDEGCECDGADRGCLGVGDEGCGLGVQACDSGIWQECGSEVGPPFTPVRQRQVVLETIAPAALVRGDADPLTVEVRAITTCPGIVVPGVVVELSATTPVMRVRKVARDDGVAPDTAAGDGVYTTTLVNAFGPGVPAQPLSLSGTAVISERDTAATVVVPLEDP
jgi:hypothetical protein